MKITVTTKDEALAREVIWSAAGHSPDKQLKILTPAEFDAWIHKSGGDLSSFARMMRMYRRTLQRKLEQRKFTDWEGYIFTLFCKAFELGYRVDGMDMKGFVRRKGCAGKYIPRKKRLRQKKADMRASV